MATFKMPETGTLGEGEGGREKGNEEALTGLVPLKAGR